MSAERKLSSWQLNALRALAVDAFARVPGSTLGMLRKRGLVAAVVALDMYGNKKTINPITDAGRALLAALGATK